MELLAITDFRSTALRLAEFAQAGTTSQEEEIYRIDVAQYENAERFEVEKEHMFRRTPLLVGFASDFPKVDSFRTLEIAGVPILIVRDKSGVLNAFLNVCRHRGATVVTEPEGCSRRFTCPYHAWTYDASGALVGVSNASNFGAFDRKDRGLVSVPCQEKDGLVWVIATPGMALDLDRHLGELGAELASFGFGAAQRFSSNRIEGPNWKLAMDTYMENYHLASLHSNTLARFAKADMAIYDRYGLHQRQVTPRKNIGEIDKASSAWDPFQYISVTYLIHPNVVILFSPEAASLFQVLPGKNVGESTTAMAHFSLLPLETPEARENFGKRIDLLIQAVTHEDYWIQNSVQSNFSSGANRTLMFGRNEGGLHHFHRTVDAAYAAALSAVAQR